MSRTDDPRETHEPGVVPAIHGSEHFDEEGGCNCYCPKCTDRNDNCICLNCTSDNCDHNHRPVVVPPEPEVDEDAERYPDVVARLRAAAVQTDHPIVLAPPTDVPTELGTGTRVVLEADDMRPLSTRVAEVMHRADCGCDDFKHGDPVLGDEYYDMLAAAAMSVFEPDRARIRAEIATAREEGIRIGREAAAQAILDHADRIAPKDDPAKATMRRHLRIGVQVAGNPATPQQVAAAIESLAQPVVPIVCHLDEAGQSTRGDDRG